MNQKLGGTKMKKLLLFLAVLFMANYMFATIRIVDKNGAGQFITIQSAINASAANDTVRVWPGTYSEQVTLAKSIIVMGSGYENTIITGNFNPTIIQTNGILQWFMVSSIGGQGINISGSGMVRNCVINGCTGTGINAVGSVATIVNCVLVNNGNWGIVCNNGTTVNVINCIAANNNNGGFAASNCYNCNLFLSYSNGSTQCTVGNQGLINVNPSFISNTDFHIPQGGVCWDKGNPSLSDPDGSVSDMGYFGGPDCPIYPVINEMIITPNGTNIDLKVKGRANY